MTNIELYGAVAFFAILYSFSDAWHDEKVIRGEKKWHFVDAMIKGLVSVFIGVLVYWFTKSYWQGITSGLIVILIRKGSFNFF